MDYSDSEITELLPLIRQAIDALVDQPSRMNRSVIMINFLASGVVEYVMNGHIYSYQELYDELLAHIAVARPDITECIEAIEKFAGTYRGVLNKEYVQLEKILDRWHAAIEADKALGDE